MTTGPLRILHTEASMGWGGQEIRVLTEGRKFLDEGHTVQLLCDADSDIFQAAPAYGVKRDTIPMKRKSPTSLAAIRRFFREWRPDVVVPHSSIDHWLCAVARIGMTSPPAIVRARHISAPVRRNIPTRWLYNRGAERVMTTSRSIVRDLTVDGFMPADRVVSVPTGIDVSIFAPGSRSEARARLGLPQERFVFTIVATLRSWKGHSFLLDAFASLAARDALLVIVGDGPQEENLRAQIAALGIADRVILAGRQREVADYFRAADAFVLPSYANEGVPQAMLQAMASALPIVTCPVGGIPELVEGLAAVAMATEKDASSLSAAMARMMEAPPTAQALAELRARVEQSYSTDSMYGAALATYRQALAAFKPSRG